MTGEHELLLTIRAEVSRVGEKVGVVQGTQTAMSHRLDTLDSNLTVTNSSLHEIAQREAACHASLTERNANVDKRVERLEHRISGAVKQWYRNGDAQRAEVLTMKTKAATTWRVLCWVGAALLGIVAVGGGLISILRDLVN